MMALLSLSVMVILELFCWGSSVDRSRRHQEPQTRFVEVMNSFVDLQLASCRFACARAAAQESVVLEFEFDVVLL